MMASFDYRPAEVRFEEPTPQLRFVIRQEVILDTDRFGNPVQAGREVKVLQQYWSIRTTDALSGEWRDVPTEEEGNTDDGQ